MEHVAKGSHFLCNCMVSIVCMCVDGSVLLYTYYTLLLSFVDKYQITALLSKENIKTCFTHYCLDSLGHRPKKGLSLMLNNVGRNDESSSKIAYCF